MGENTVRKKKLLKLLLPVWCLLPPPPRMGIGDFFPKNAFHGGQFLWGKFLGGLIYMGALMIRSYQEGRSFTKCIFQ